MRCMPSKNIYVPPADLPTWEALEALANQEGRSTSGTLLRLLRDALDRTGTDRVDDLAARVAAVERRLEQVTTPVVIAPPAWERRPRPARPLVDYTIPEPPDPNAPW